MSGSILQEVASADSTKDAVHLPHAPSEGFRNSRASTSARTAVRAPNPDAGGHDSLLVGITHLTPEPIRSTLGA